MCLHNKKNWKEAIRLGGLSSGSEAAELPPTGPLQRAIGQLPGVAVLLRRTVRNEEVRVWYRVVDGPDGSPPRLTLEEVRICVASKEGGQR